MPLLFIILAFNICDVFASGVKLPPVPGKGNDDTLEGIDVNKNNVRDDVEHFIYYDMAKKDPKLFRAYLKLAESIQLQFRSRFDRETLLTLENQVSNDKFCILYRENKTRLLDLKDLKKLTSKIVNTKQRGEATNQEGTTLGSWVIKDAPPKNTWKNLCR